MGTCVCVSWALFFQPAPPACPSQIKTRPWHVFGRQLSQIRLSKQAGHRLEDKVSVFQHKITKKKPHVFFGTKTFNSLKMSCWTPRPLSKDIGHIASIFFFFFFALFILSAYRMFVYTGRVNVHTQSTESNVHLFQSTDKPRNNVLPAIWASLRPVNLAHKIDQHILFYDNGKYIYFLVV